MALEEAHTSLTAMKDAITAAWRNKVAEIADILDAQADGHADAGSAEYHQALNEAYLRADDVNSLAGMADAPRVGDVLLLLCDLLKPFGEIGPVHPLALRTYRRALRRIEAMAECDGLAEIVDALRSMNAACLGWHQRPSGIDLWQMIVTSRSTASEGGFADDADQIVDVAERRGRTSGLSGMLTADRGKYLQCVQGPCDAVADYADATMFDPRQRVIRLTAIRAIDSRSFPDWNACFARLGPLHEVILARIRGKLVLTDLGEAAALDLLQTIAATVRPHGRPV